jgi:hypothetical protein
MNAASDDDGLQADIEHDIAAILEDAEFVEREPWMQEEEEEETTEWPRYQVHVTLLHEGDVP